MLLNPEDSHNECTTGVPTRTDAVVFGPHRDAIRGWARCSVNWRRLGPESVTRRAWGTPERESGPRPKAGAATLTICPSAQDVALLSPSSSDFEGAARTCAAPPAPQSGHHSNGATSSSLTFIQSSIRWSLQVHTGPTRPSASIPVALCTRVNARPHPLLEQIPTCSSMSCCAQSGSNVILLRPTLSKAENTAVWVSAFQTPSPSHFVHPPVTLDLGDHPCSGPRSNGSRQRLVSVYRVTFHRSTSVTSRGGTWPGTDSVRPSWATGRKCFPAGLPRAIAMPHLSSPDMRAPRSPGWEDVIGSALLVLAISVPTMIVEEDWHGRPMIDQSTHLWIIACCIVAAAFFTGGAIVAFRRPSAPTRYAAATGAVAVAVLLLGGLSRRLWLVHENVSVEVRHLWLLGVVAAVAMSIAGSVLGRQLTR
jgi:hypothetical protein